MLEVEKITFEGEDYLKVKMKSLDPETVKLITSIDGWFQAREPMTYGLPYSQLGDFFNKTKDLMVVWKGQGDNMGSLVKGVNTKDVPKEDLVVDYQPKIELRPHQKQTFNLMIQRDMLLISDQEGVGKTPPILCSHAAKCHFNVVKWGLYVTKAGLIYDVKNQAEKFTDMNVKVVTGTPKKREDIYHELEDNDDVDLVVMSYELYRDDFDHIRSLDRIRPFDVMYVDEAHKVKNPTSSLSKKIHWLETDQKYAITASPIINEIIDMWNVMYWLGAFNLNYFAFRAKYCELDGWGKVKKYKNLSEVKRVLQSNMLRRLKSEVLTDLPPVIPKNVYVDMTPKQRKLYKVVEQAEEGETIQDYDFDDEDVVELEFEDIPGELAKYSRLIQVAESTEIVGGQSGVKGSAKLKELDSLIEEIVERGEKAVVFSRSRRFVEVMVEHFSSYNPAMIHGDVDAHAKASEEVSERQSQVDKFQEDESCKVIFCTESASREGWTGTSANNVIFTSKPWSPAYVSQCIGRVWRFGAQKHNSINVYSLIARDTVDERIEKLLEEKQFTIESTVEQPMSTTEILNVLDGSA